MNLIKLSFRIQKKEWNMGSKTYLGYDEERRANVYLLLDGRKMYKYLDGRIEVI
jgi:hypothetical protein